MTTPRLTGRHPIQMTYIDRWDTVAHVSVVDGKIGVTTLDDPLAANVEFTPGVLRYLASVAEGDGRVCPVYVVDLCYWADCPEHRCLYAIAHTQWFCRRPTCRES